MKIESEAHLAEVIAARTAPVLVQGGGTRAVACQGCDPLDLSALRGVTLYEPQTLTLVARAATPVAEIEALLANNGQQLGFEPPDWRGLLGSEGHPAVGALIAANLSGPRRITAGAARDAALGVRFVDGRGQVIKNGGRVMKNVTGLDLVRLLAGSWGTLGILSEVALKVLPLPEVVATLIIPDCDLASAVALMSKALGSPYGVSGAARLPDGRVMIRVEGFAASVVYRAERLAELLGPGAEPVAAVDWRLVRDVLPFAGRAGDVWRFSVPPTDAPEVATRLGGEILLDWGGGLIWALLPEGSDARALAAPYRGHAMLVRAGADTRARLPRFEPEAAGVARLSAGIRAQFDPKRIFNPGLMG